MENRLSSDFVGARDFCPSVSAAAEAAVAAAAVAAATAAAAEEFSGLTQFSCG